MGEQGEEAICGISLWRNAPEPIGHQTTMRTDGRQRVVLPLTVEEIRAPIREQVQEHRDMANCKAVPVSRKLVS